MAGIEVFTSPNCGYCERAKALLRAKGLAFAEFDIAADEGRRQVLLERLPRVRAVPQIFIDGEHIGGYEDLQLLEESGRLDELTG
jgi:glutaredoxin 3